MMQDTRKRQISFLSLSLTLSLYLYLSISNSLSLTLYLSISIFISLSLSLFRLLKVVKINRHLFLSFNLCTQIPVEKGRNGFDVLKKFLFIKAPMEI